MYMSLKRKNYWTISFKWKYKLTKLLQNCNLNYELCSKNTREIHPEDSSRLANDVPDQGSSKQNTEPRMISPAKSSAERSFVSYYYIIVNETAVRDWRVFL